MAQDSQHLGTALLRSQGFDVLEIRLADRRNVHPQSAWGREGGKHLKIE